MYYKFYPGPRPVTKKFGLFDELSDVTVFEFPGNRAT
jgi:hypothetical protein